MKTALPVLGLTMGDPAGIGPEICLRALREPAVRVRCTPVLFGDAAVLKRLAEATGLSPEEFEDRLTVNFEHDVAHHLFAVAAGLKSVVPGEFEILGQLRRALELAVEEQSAGSEVTDIFQRAIRARHGRKP